jgi:hypothetical protein
MYRYAYRNFGDHESLVVTHTVRGSSTSSRTGIRWYELRIAGGDPSIYQQGTYFPTSDSLYRWMSSAAMDKDGDIALGYSVGSSSVMPGLRVTGKLAEDPVGTYQAETTLRNGSGVQLSYDRWGDYSSMSSDPSDDCTFWYTGEYLPNTGDFNWTTWIGSFNLCTATGGGGGGGGTDDFSIAASPSSITIVKGKSGNVTISTVLTSGSSQKVALSASGKPSGVSVSFTPTSVTPGGTPSASKMKITVGSKTSKGTYTLTVTGKGASATHTVPVVLTVKGTTLSKG